MAFNIKMDYNDIKKDLFNESKWLEDGHKIMSRIKNFQKLEKYLFDTINKFKEIDNPKIKDILSVETYLIKTSETTNDYIKNIKEKIKYFKSDFELDLENEKECENDNQNKVIIKDMMNDKELLENRKRELEDLYKTAGEIKYLMEDRGMKPTDEQQKVFDKLDNLKDQNLNNVNNNVEKKKEIDKKENNLKAKKKKKCIIY